MITLTQDGKKLATVNLVGGKLKVDYTEKGPADAILHAMRGLFDSERLTDEEVYRTMPFRLTGRTFASISGHDAETLKDPSVYNGLQAKFDAESDASPRQKALLKQSEARRAASAAAETAQEPPRNSLIAE